MKLRGPSEWFAFYRGEFSGAALLFFTGLIFAILPRFLFHYKEPQKIDFKSDTAAVARLIRSQQEYLDSTFRNSKRKRSFYYGSKNQLIAMGFSAEAAERIDKAKKQGKRFESYADLSAASGMDSESLVKIVRPASFFPRKTAKESDAVISVELNGADSNELKKLPGIGGKTAGRILKYRTKLGGFYSPEQLMEIWYIDTSAIRKLSGIFYADASAIHKMRINVLPEIQMSDHPYISKNQARILAAWTRQNGSLTLEKFKVMKGFSEKERERLLPYLDFQ